MPAARDCEAPSAGNTWYAGVPRMPYEDQYF